MVDVIGQEAECHVSGVSTISASVRRAPGAALKSTSLSWVRRFRILIFVFVFQGYFSQRCDPLNRTRAIETMRSKLIESLGFSDFSGIIHRYDIS